MPGDVILLLPPCEVSGSLELNAGSFCKGFLCEQPHLSRRENAGMLKMGPAPDGLHAGPGGLTANGMQLLRFQPAPGNRAWLALTFKEGF